MSTLDQAFIRAYQATNRKTHTAEAAPAPRTSAASDAATTAGTPSARRYFVDSAHPADFAPHYGDGIAPGHDFAAAEAALKAERAALDRTQAATAAVAATVPPEALRAAYETQRFAWPRKLEVLIAAAGSEFAEFAAELEQRSRSDRRTLVVTGAERGSGRSLVTLALARLVANRNLRTVVVDLDLRQPNLGELLGLRPELGWDDACAEKLPLSEVLVESLDDRLTLLPLRHGLANPRALAGNGFLHETIDDLRTHFDCVIVDAGPLADDGATIDLAAALNGCSFDDGLVVRDRRRTTPQQVHEVGRRLAVLGVRRWDVAENFTEIQGY